MDARRIVIFCFVVGSILGQEATDHGYLAQLQLSLREEKIPSIINYMLNNSLELHQITTQDIIQLSKLDRYDQNDIVKVLEFFNITNIYTVDNLELLLTTLNISFGVFYEDWKTKLALSNDQVTQVVNSLSIPANFWRDVVLHDDTNLYNDLRQGIYDEEHVTQALTAIGKNYTQVYSSARDLLGEKVSQKSPQEFMTILTAQGWTMRTALMWYQALNITTRDVYQVDKFRQIFTNITNDLNQNTTLAVFTNPNRLALHRIAFENLHKIVDGVNVKVEANGLEVTLNKTRSLGANIVEVASNQSGSKYIEITESYNSTGVCTYVTLRNGQMSATEVPIDNMTIKRNGTRFILGSLLICEERLYGLAREEYEDNILFDSFYTADQPPEDTEEDKEHEFGNKGLALLPCVLILTFNFLITLVLL